MSGTAVSHADGPEQSHIGPDSQASSSTSPEGQAGTAGVEAGVGAGSWDELQPVLRRAEQLVVSPLRALVLQVRCN
jgi:hypothetical protein